jgi:hypothetical protein
MQGCLSRERRRQANQCGRIALAGRIGGATTSFRMKLGLPASVGSCPGSFPECPQQMQRSMSVQVVPRASHHLSVLKSLRSGRAWRLLGLAVHHGNPDGKRVFGQKGQFHSNIGDLWPRFPTQAHHHAPSPNNGSKCSSWACERVFAPCGISKDGTLSRLLERV